MENKKLTVANDGCIKFNEGYEKRGGINTDVNVPRPDAPKPQPPAQPNQNNK